MSGIISELLKNFISGNLLIFLSKLLAIIILVLLGFLIIKITNKILKSVLKIKKDDKRTITVSRLINSVLNFFVGFVVLAMIFTELNMDIGPLLASAGVLGFAIGFGSQEIVKDFLAGMFLILEKIMFVGDVVEIDDFKGIVIDIKLRTISIQNWLGQVKTINNGSISHIINFSKSESLAVVNFSVEYGTDLKKMNRIMPEFLARIKEKNQNIIDMPQFSGITNLSESGIDLMLVAKTISNTQIGVERMIRQELLDFLTENKIAVAYPQIIIRNK